MRQLTFTYAGLPGRIEVSDAGAFVTWGGASFWSTAAIGELRQLIDNTVNS